MSVLSEIVGEREGWAARHREVRYSWTKTVIENAVLIAIGLLVYNHYDVILNMIGLSR
jgi:hypothetical protein